MFIGGKEVARCEIRIIWGARLMNDSLNTTLDDKATVFVLLICNLLDGEGSGDASRGPANQGAFHVVSIKHLSVDDCILLEQKWKLESLMINRLVMGRKGCSHIFVC